MNENGMPELRALFSTARLVVLQLMEDDADYETAQYDIYVDGVRRLTTAKTVETVFDLKPDTSYVLQAVRAGRRSAELTVRTQKEFVTLDVRDFGARGDGITDDTGSIQAAVMTCPPGGRVYLPEGTYTVTGIFLKSDLILELGRGAVLKAIPDRKRIPVLPGRIESYDEESEYLPAAWEGAPRDSYASVLTGLYVRNVVICGQGAIDGSAGFDNWWNDDRGDGPARPRMIFMNHCEDVTIQGLSLKNAPAWNIHLFFCRRVRCLDMRVEAPARSRNTDGLVPEFSSGVEAAGVRFSSGNDCVAIKSGTFYLGKTYPTPTSDISIHHCRMERGHGGITLGSETAASIDDIRITNCRFVGTDRGLRVKTRRGRGSRAHIGGIVFDHVKMFGVRSPFIINCFYFCGVDARTEYVSSKKALPVDESTPQIGAVTIRNVNCAGCHVAGIFFYGLPEAKIESVLMENVRISFDRGAVGGRPAMMEDCEVTKKQGIFIRNARRAIFRDVEVSGYIGVPIDVEDVDEWEWS